MNFGYYDLQDIIYKNAIRMKYPNASKFAKDTAKLQWQMIEEKEGDMGKKDWNLAYGFPVELEKVVSQFEKGFNFSGYSMKRDQGAQEIYKWAAEQGKDKIEKFISWATSVERIQFVGKYKKEPGYIKNDWKLAFYSATPEVTRNEDGSLNV